MSIAITLTGTKAHYWLEHSRHGLVTAVYRQSLYLADHRDALICLGSRRLGPGPINALCDAEWESTGSINAGDPWQRRGDALHVGPRHHFHIGHPTVWRPAPAKGPWDPDAIAERLQRARGCISATEAGPLMPLLLQQGAPDRNRLQSAIEQQATSGIHALLQWLEDSFTRPGSPDDIPEGAVSLIGLGPGLTPSGDDFLCGVLVALRTLKRDAAADGLAAWIQRHAPALTNSISLAHLSAACDGEALEPVHRGLHAILDNSGDDEIEAALEDLSAVGHSSGWDAFSGVLAVTEAWQRKRSAHPRRNCA